MSEALFASEKEKKAEVRTIALMLLPLLIDGAGQCNKWTTGLRVLLLLTPLLHTLCFINGTKMDAIQSIC